MANALGGAAQNLPIANNLQATGPNQNQQDQVRVNDQNDERVQSSTLRTQEQQQTNEINQARTEDSGQEERTQLAQSQSPSVSASDNSRGGNIDILV